MQTFTSPLVIWQAVSWTSEHQLLITGLTYSHLPINYRSLSLISISIEIELFFIEIGWIVHRNAKNISSRVVNNHWLLLLLVHCQYLYGYGIRQTAYKTGHTHSGRIKSNKIWNVGWNWIRVVIMRIINERNLCIHTKRLEFREPVLINNFLFLCYFLHLCGSIAIMLTEWNICDWNEKTLKTNHTQIKHRIRKNKSQSDFQFSLNVIGQSCKDLAVGQIRLWIVQSEKKRWKARL